MGQESVLSVPELQDILNNPVIIRSGSYECRVCCVHITSTNFDDNLKIHLEGGPHLKKFSRIASQLKFYSSVLYLDRTTIPKPNILAYFQRFGKIIKYDISPYKDQQSYVVFSSPDCVNEALVDGDTHFIDRTKIRVYKSTRMVFGNTGPDQNKIKFKFKKFFLNISLLTDAYSEINFLYSLNGLTDSDKKSISEFIKNLSGILTQIYNDSNLLAYGSTTLPRATKNSDIDITLLVEDKYEITEVLMKIKDYKPLKKVCYRVLIIPSKRLPLIKLYSRNLSMSIDLSINNHLALRNNELIRRYLALSQLFDANEMSTLDAIIYVVKLWRHQNLLSGDLFIHINSYGWILMIIFYLQHIKYLPSLQDPKLSIIRPNISLSEHISRHRINNWNCDFVQNLAIFEPPKFLPDIMESIMGFFNFYSQEFNFDRYVIDIRTGGDNRIEKSTCINNLKSIQDIEINLSTIKNFNKPIIIQDPFDLSQNISKNLCKCLLNDMINSMKSTLKRMQDSKIELVTNGISNGINRESLYTVLMPCQIDSINVNSHYQIVFEPLDDDKIELFVESAVRLVINTLFHRFNSSVKYFNLQKPCSVSVTIEPKTLPDKLFSDFDIDTFEDLIFEIITPNFSWNKLTSLKRNGNACNSEIDISTNFIKYEMTFYLCISSKLLVLKFSYRSINSWAWIQLFTQIKDELKSINITTFEIF